MRQFEQLGDQVTERWKKEGFHSDRFSAIATDVLRESRIFDSVDPNDVVDWLGRTQELPRQATHEFGQPGLNVYVAENFCIQALFWLDSTTAIHAHSFAGAFGVLKGSSLHSRYEFVEKQMLAKEFCLGDVRFLSSETLQRGDVRTIEPNNGLIHSLFHLDEPSVSIVVRTITNGSLQYAFIKPYIAIDQLDESLSEQRKLKMLDSLRRIDLEQMWRFCRLVAENCRTWMLYQVLLAAQRMANRSPGEWEKLVEVSGKAHGKDLVDTIVTCVEQENLSRRLMWLRSSVRNPDHRFFLGLLINVPTRSCLLRLVSEKYGSNDPGRIVMQWLRDMSENGEFWTTVEPELLEVIGSVLQQETLVAAGGAPAESEAASPAPGEALQRLWEASPSIKFLRPLFIQ
jgi:hypothetical protein